MSKVTGLVAVWNAEKYLRECLDSLERQTLRDIQVVCINDASTDGSQSIIEEYAARDARFELVSLTENQGQAVARNEGLKLATGDFITMLDSDDRYAPDTLEKACEALEKNAEADCAVLRLIEVYEDGREEEYPRPEAQVLGGEEAFRLSLDWSLHGLYLVRADLHRRYPYDTSCRLYSDDNTTRLHYLHARKVVLSEGQYFYRKHAASMTTACSLRRFDLLDANLSMKRTLLKEIENGCIKNAEEILDFYETHRWLNLIDAWWYFYCHKSAFTAGERKDILGRMEKAFHSIEKARIAPRLRHKFGYHPFSSFFLLSMMEAAYFFLKKVLHH